MMTASNIHYEYADRVRQLGAGGIGALFLLAQRIELVKDIDRDLHLLKRPSALPRIRPCPEHLAESPRRRPSHGTSRAALPTRSTSCGSGPIASRPDHRRRLLPTLPRGRRPQFDGHHQWGASLRVWARQPSEFFEEAIWRPTAASCPATVQGRDGLRLRRPVWIPSAADLAGQHLEPLFLLNRSGNRPRRNGRTSSWIRPSRRIAVGPASAASCCGAIPSSPRPSIWIDGTPRATRDSSSNTRPTTRLKARGRRPAGRLVPPPEPTAARSRPPSGGKPERVKPAIVRRRGYEDIELLEEMVAGSLSADGVQEELSDGRPPQAGGGRQGPAASSSRNTATSSTSPTTGR